MDLFLHLEIFFGRRTCEGAASMGIARIDGRMGELILFYVCTLQSYADIACDSCRDTLVDMWYSQVQGSSTQAESGDSYDMPMIAHRRWNQKFVSRTSRTTFPSVQILCWTDTALLIYNQSPTSWFWFIKCPYLPCFYTQMKALDGGI